MSTIILDPNNPLHLVPATLATNPGAVAVIPVFSPAAPDQTLVLRSRVHLRRLPPELAAQLARQEAESRGNGAKVEPPTHLEVGRLLLTIPADLAKNLRGPVEQRHPLWIFSVHRAVYDDAIRQATTGIVLPGHVAASTGGGIIKP